MTAAVALLLIVAVLASWLAAAGLVRLRAPLDRLHCVTFLTVASGVPLLIAAAMTDGPTDRLAKILLVIFLMLFGGAGLSHALGQAIYRRAQSSADADADDA